MFNKLPSGCCNYRLGPGSLDAATGPVGRHWMAPLSTAHLRQVLLPPLAPSHAGDWDSGVYMWARSGLKVWPKACLLPKHPTSPHSTEASVRCEAYQAGMRL